MAEIRGIILDVDGTLIDSNAAHARAWQDALGAYGYNPLYGEVRQLIGMGGDQLLPILIGVDSQSEEGQEINELRSEIFQTRYLPWLRPFPQARKLLAQMRAVGLTLVVGSSTGQDELEKLLSIANVADLVQEVIAADDVVRSKPEPDIVETALAKMAHPRNTVLLLGDTPYDLEAATAAGIAMIALRCGGWQDVDLQGALAIYDDPADLLAHFTTSPLVADQLVAV